ncbi:hypothetical protein I4U23_028783 [Adineta vaga]|nr:hypothetical protein I4U23_028783 [Adineta vaga]
MNRNIYHNQMFCVIQIFLHQVYLKRIWITMNIHIFVFHSVPSSIKKTNYNYCADQLQIIDVCPSQVSFALQTNHCTIRLSYSIPKMYECTSLKDKYVKIMILTGNDQRPDSYPSYRFLHDQN